MTTYRVALANKIRGGRAIGNLYGVSRYIDGRFCGWMLEPQDSEADARAFADDCARGLVADPIAEKIADRLAGEAVDSPPSRAYGVTR